MATTRYCPSNGTEGEIFMSEFCERCRRWPDDPEAPDQCQIAGAALAFNINDPEFPAEWVSDDGGLTGRCTAFEPRDE